MRSTVLKNLWREKENLALSLWQGLRASEARHYESEDPELLRQRCDRLVEEFLTALEWSSHAFADYVRGTAQDRLAEGYQLDELQLVLNMLRQRIWKLTVASLEDRDLMVEYLDVATSTLERARDAAAHTYLEAARTRRQIAPDTDQLFRGTESMVVLDE